ncbi:MAG TPA: peptidase domain-containing ABC transporter [Gemmatimonadales bacterium]|nr:peptidase domain-containing ABC transporter [Gemmatimonadales bacterium]
MLQSLLAFGGRGRLPLILQTEATECGLACLAMVASYHGHAIDLNSLRRRHPVSLNGVTLKGLMQVASHLSLACRPLRFELPHLRELRLPAIVHWDMDHFVVLKAVTGKGIVIHDPASGERRYRLAEASKHLTGVALELTPMEGFIPKDETARLPLASFLGHTRGLAQALAQVLVLSVVLEAFVIASPFYLQLAVDEAIARGDADLLLVLALGFGLLTAISVASTALRSSILLVLQNTLSLQMAASLFRHLIRLPLAYFEKRHVGDVLSRFASTEPIRRLLAEGLIAALIDGVMAAATLVMIFVYSAELALVVLVALALYAALRIALYRLFRRRSEAAIQAKARESSTLIETLRAVQTVKLFNHEGEREGQWLNRYAEVVNASVRLGRVDIAFKTMNDAIFGLENILTVYLGARLALDGSLTIGMIFAFLSYKRHFTDKAVQLVEKALDFRILDLHLERLADIALTPPEPGHDRPLAYTRPIAGRIELRDVCFRYAETEPFVLENLSLTIEPGQFVTIAGPSGGGKTTLAKIMLGLLEPTSGEVLVDGLPLARIGARAYREQVGAVMQDDQLLSGSIADNICFFDQAFDLEWMMRCAEMAGIHDEIMAMPMAYNTLVGDMGSSLSGGQKQRVLLARALYRRPRILFLDEGTAHLDVDTERHINEGLKRLAITRVSVAHRPETMRAADRVVLIERHHPNRRPW